MSDDPFGPAPEPPERWIYFDVTGPELIPLVIIRCGECGDQLMDVAARTSGPEQVQLSKINERLLAHIARRHPDRVG